MMNYGDMYDAITALAGDLEKTLYDDKGFMAYRRVKALAACYELHDYLADLLADDDEFEDLMYQYGEVLGAKLVKENERLNADPSFELPEGLDEKCLAAIDAAFDN